MIRYFLTLNGILFCLATMLRAQSFYDYNTIQRIEIHFNQSNWDYQLDTAKNGSEGYILAQWVKINGVQFDSVGVKYKGNSSYNSNQVKNPFHLKRSHGRCAALRWLCGWALGSIAVPCIVLAFLFSAVWARH